MMRAPASALSGRRCGGSVFLLVIILGLSAYIHMWNPAGVPLLMGDEGIYVERAVGVLDGELLYGRHDHPFFGQIVIAGFMQVTGYPDLFENPQTDPSYLEAFYAYPRAFMGLLAVIDTLLVYLIADRVFGRRVAAVAAVLFAATTMSLTLKMIMLDSILLPFVLLSVLFAVYSRGSDRKHALLLASGACLGLAILTKVPAVAMVPLCAVLAYSASGRIRDVGVWFAPAAAVVAVWPAVAAQAGQFDMWTGDVLQQAGRSNDGLPGALEKLFAFDPILMPLGMAGFVFAAACLILCIGRERRAAGGEGKTGGGEDGPAHGSLPPPASSPPDTCSGRILGGAVHACRGAGSNIRELRRHGFLVVWFSSILLFFGMIGYVSSWHLSMLLPALCIGGAVLIIRGGGRIARGARGPAGDRATLIAVLVIGLVGLSTAGVLVQFDTQSPEFAAASFMLQNHDETDTVKAVSVTSSWVLSDVYGMHNVTTYAGYGVREDTGKALLMVNNYAINVYTELAELCGDPAIRTSAAYDYQQRCRTAAGVIEIVEGGVPIREFVQEGGLVDALPQLPYGIERHLLNPYVIIERPSAG